MPKFDIFVYKELGSDKAEHIFTVENNRQAVGILKTIFDNFNPKHIDIIRKDN